MPKTYTCYTDGAIRDNGTPQAVSASATWIKNEAGEERFLVSYCDDGATSNRAEMMAAIQAIEYIKFRDAKFKIYSDSAYLVENRQGKANKDLWARLDKLKSERKIEFFHVKGHSGDLLNETVDELAKKVLKNPEEFRKMQKYDKKRIIFLDK